jgi:peptidyl-prolyl cis-trans isomerase A (cyclophilin A)
MQKTLTILLALVAALALSSTAFAVRSMPIDEGKGTPSSPGETGEEVMTRAPVYVRLECSRGDIVLEVHPEWQPIGAAHFIELIKAGFYDGAPWFRVIDGFMAQTGIAADPNQNTEWSARTIVDEDLVMGCERGFVAFGKSSLPNSRSTHFFINFADNRRFLDPQGFAAFAVVVEGMDVADELQRIPDEELAETGLSQPSLAQPGGMRAFGKAFPDADYIVRAVLLDDYGTADAEDVVAAEADGKDVQDGADAKEEQD